MIGTISELKQTLKSYHNAEFWCWHKNPDTKVEDTTIHPAASLHQTSFPCQVYLMEVLIHKKISDAASGKDKLIGTS